MSAGILWGETKHTRLEPVRHEFRYPLFYFVLDVDEFSAAPSTWLFGRNSPGIFSIREADYLKAEGGALADRLRALLERRGYVWRDEKAFLVTMPRVCGYIFNPVSFYLMMTADGKLGAMVCEVNNTFGEKHLYIHTPPAPAPLPYSFPLTKEFYVSPFFDTTGRYDVAVNAFGDLFDVGITLTKERPVFWAGLTGQRRDLTPMNLGASLVRFPLTAFLTMTRIHIHAVILHLKKLVPLMKPAPASPWTVRSRQNLIHRLRLGIIAFWRRQAGADEKLND